jgi:nitrite reductase/ring-hydroxylating ferredoxin subunit
VHRPSLTRRAVLAGGTGAACGAALCACTTYNLGPAPAPPAAPPPAAGGGSGGAATGALASTADIPVGGGVVFADQDVVVTQPTAGEFRAFSATCTHQGCFVSEVTEGTINCPCHGSRFDVTDGAVVDGPADAPLPEKGVEVNGEDIVLA